MPGAQIAGYSIAICICVSKQFLSKQQSDDRFFWGPVEKWLHFFKNKHSRKDLQQNVSNLFPFGPHIAKNSQQHLSPI
jgi:hypothetical protein